MATQIHALAAQQPGGRLEPFSFDAGELPDDQIELEVNYCGVCHSDLSMLQNAWTLTKYPFVPGHEVTGRVVAAGSNVPGLPGEPGDPLGKTVGLGWYSQSCMGCAACLSGNHNLCGTAEQTIVGRHGGFATRIRCHWAWALPLPPGVDPVKAGPLFCGGLTVFNPIIQNEVKPTDRVGVIGIGGLGHMALKFLNKWGCEVYAFSSNASKREEILGMGAHHVVNSRSADDLGKLTGRLNFLLSTVNANLDWPAMLATLAPKGRLHLVGVVPEPVALPAYPMISGQKSLSGTPLGSPSTAMQMLQFCARHGISPTTEVFPMTQANEALEHLRAGKARYRIVLENDLGRS